MTNGQTLKAHADRLAVPYRTLSDVRECLSQAARYGTADSMAKLLLRHGRLTDEAILFIGDNYPGVWE